ncbi:uncharacterized protein [Neodiprion pinetum]|uniref:uncharacterized protein n=1 Tax=Neodiprion pinetum TaxID=441929 RepID=UPI003715ABAD
MKDVFKPVVTPLQELVNVSRGTKLVKEEVKEELKTETKDEPKNEMEDSFATAEQQKLDTVYGVRSLSTVGLMVGDSSISFERDSVRIGDTLYPKTQGLLELLFKKMPNSAHVTRNDRENYRNILLATNALRKYCKDVSPLSQMSKRTGKGVLLPQAWVIRRGVETDYIFWDDANELVERLCLLLASQAAGNTSHNNEIMSILEELREAGIIYYPILVDSAII